MKRNAAVAGRFYPGTAGEIREMLAGMVEEAPEKRRVFGALVPHAGYVFSGPTAGKVFGAIKVPDRVILLHPSHNYDYPPCALWPGGSWETPLGEVAVDAELTEAIGRIPGVIADEKAHLPEHSGEVIVPFVQYVRPEARMAFVCITRSCQYEGLKRLGEGLAKIVQDAGEPVLIVASSDMSHEGGRGALEKVRAHDPMAIERMETLDAQGLLKECLRVPITMCGVRPAAAMIEAAKVLGATRGELLMRATSADSPYGRGDYVVGYAGMIFH